MIERIKKGEERDGMLTVKAPDASICLLLPTLAPSCLGGWRMSQLSLSERKLPIASRHAPQPSRLPDDFLEHVPRRSSFGDMPCLAEGPDPPDSEPSKDFGDGTWAGPAPKGQ